MKTKYVYVSTFIDTCEENISVGRTPQQITTIVPFIFPTDLSCRPTWSIRTTTIDQLILLTFISLLTFNDDNIIVSNLFDTLFY